MNTARLGVALLAGHTLVAAIAWLHGYASGRLTERRNTATLDLRYSTTPYDWAIDGEAVQR